MDLWIDRSDFFNYKNYLYFWSLLNTLERVKAQRFVREPDRRRYVAAHGKLRRILATYLRIPPDTIALATHEHGKPFIVGDERHGIKFNMAHSGDFLLVGVSSGYDIGVDIEVWSDSVDYEAVLDLCFADAERYFWNTLPVEQRQAFFYRLWTRKESFVKAVGLGLGLDVAQVVTAPGGPSRFLSLPSGCGEPGDWSLTDLELATGLSGALTISGGDCLANITYKRL
ncbi:hypothetical protein CWO84_13355 [Methylomonas sp. Kb3]|nr:hypothetical protein CWO84_13355 [Methylomonas sp. Kb3]